MNHALLAHSPGSQQIMVLADCQCLQIRPCLTRHPGVIIHFEHSEDSEYAKPSLRFLRLWQRQIMRQQRDLHGDAF